MQAHTVECPAGIKRAYGGLLVNDAGQILVREPRGHWDGYVWTFAKGKPDAGETPEQTALREVREETGIEAEITAELDGWFLTRDSATKMYLMRLATDHGDFIKKETATVRWVSWAEAEKLIQQTTKPDGRARDLAMLAAARQP